MFGEGARDPVGRGVMYEAAADRVSRVIEVTDILTNPSEVVRGVGLNQDGSLGVARGFQAYFFSTDLRLQGVADLPSGGAGAALHPLHADYPSLDNLDGTYSPDTHLAFLGTGEGTIEIIDAFHFEQLGRIFIRDVITGPLKAALPFPGDNDGFVCSTVPIFNGTGDMVGNAIDIYADAQGTMPHPADGRSDRRPVRSLEAVRHHERWRGRSDRRSQRRHRAAVPGAGRLIARPGSLANRHEPAGGWTPAGRFAISAGHPPAPRQTVGRKRPGRVRRSPALAGLPCKTRASDPGP